MDQGEGRLTDQQAEKLLSLLDVIRDPLHGDIRLTELEMEIIDIEDFQRLRGINQLAMTSIVYPGAVHTRFLHSLGVMYVAQQIIDFCNDNARNYTRLAKAGWPTPVLITPYQRLLIRLMALTHDMAHVPYGHTFEKEGKVFEKDEWQDQDRAELLLGPVETARVGSVTLAIRQFFEEQGLPRAAADALQRDLYQLHVTKRKKAHELPYPFIHDLVGNTICADLIDYVQRDMMFCGLRETFGDRFMQYLAVVPVSFDPKAESKTREASPGKVESLRATDSEFGPAEAFPARNEEAARFACRVVLLGYRYDALRNATSKKDITREAIDLMRRRLSVAEKLYFHRTKLKASAMLLASAQSISVKPLDIWNMTDEEVLKKIEQGENSRAKKLASDIRRRHLFWTVFRAGYATPDENPHGHYALLKTAYDRMKDPTERLALIEKIESAITFETGKSAVGTVAISCPDWDMNLKGFDVFVWKRPDEDPARLQNSVDEVTKLEIDAIQKAHRQLWTLEVIVDPDMIEKDATVTLTRKLAAAIVHELGIRNEVAVLRDVKGDSFEDWMRKARVRSALREFGVDTSIRAVHRDALEDLSAHGSEADMKNVIKSKLIEWDYLQ